MKLRNLLTKNQKHITPKLNSVLRQLIDATNGRYKNTDLLLEHIINTELAQYQSKMLKHCLRNFKLIADKLEFTVKFNKKKDGSCALLEQVLANIETVSVKSIQEHITIYRDNPGKLNQNTKYSTKSKRPSYSKCFDICVNDDLTKVAKVYTSTGNKKHSTVGLRFSLNPSRFTRRELAQVFMHIKSIIGKRYKEIMEKARITRVDMAIDLYGVSSLFVYTMNINKKMRGGAVYPEDGEVAETVEHGKSSKLKVYDKLLEVMVKQEESINDKVMATRAEHQNRGKGKVRLKDLEKCTNRLSDLAFVDPLDIAAMHNRTVKSLIRNRCGKQVETAVKRAEAKGNTVNMLRTDDALLEKQHRNLLTVLKKTILEPNKQ
jgi:hypothetical protein